jgi:hypothetical protein
LRKPVVLFIDDGSSTSEQQLRSLLDPSGVELRLMHPENVEQEDLESSDVVVVDYFLENWKERDDLYSASRAPRDGLAVAGTLRSRLLPPLSERRPGAGPPKAVAFTLWSAHLNEATFGLPAAVRAHVFARENNLEWAFDRGAIVNGVAVERLSELAHAVSQLPEAWPGRSGGQEALDLLSQVLSVPDELWKPEVLDAIVNCRPPVHELSERSHGLAVVRWLLHRILPYPTFLLDELYLRARLRLDALPEDPDAPLWEELAPYKYLGMLKNFDGSRWWRAGIEHWLWEATGGESSNPRSLQDLGVRLGGQASRAWRLPVVLCGADLEKKPNLSEISDAVRLRPDDWPPYADAAYGSREECATDPTLSALVDPADRYLLVDFDSEASNASPHVLDLPAGS